MPKGHAIMLHPKLAFSFISNVLITEDCLVLIKSYMFLKYGNPFSLSHKDKISSLVAILLEAFTRI